MSQIISGQSASAITPNDSTNLTTVTRGIYVGVSGDVKVDMADNSTVIFVGLSSGGIHPIAVKKVYATGTTATNIVGVY
jgi:hypothetical protein